MKIVHLSVSDVQGGAAKAAYSLNAALNKAGIPSSMLVQEKHGDDPTVHAFVDSPLKKTMHAERYLLDYFSIRFLTIQSRGRFSFPYFGTDVSRHPLVREASVVHLHWINGGFFSFRTFAKLAATKKPIVWTLHDMWAFTGGCHYTGGCERYLTECKECPSLKIRGANDMSKHIFSHKKTLYDKLRVRFVTCSNWLAGEAKKSYLLSNRKIAAIPNPLEVDLYKPGNKALARKGLSLPADKTLILFGTMTLKEERKGFAYLKEGLNVLYNKYPDIRTKVEILVFGASDEGILRDIPFETHSLGRISGTERLVDCYNAADVFVAPSLEDNLPNTVMEALACGVPVVAFKTGGVPEMVDHMKNGYLAELRSPQSLAEGIYWTIGHTGGESHLQEEARQKVVGNYTPEIVAGKYRAIYEELLASSKSFESS